MTTRDIFNSDIPIDQITPDVFKEKGILGEIKDIVTEIICFAIALAFLLAIFCGMIILIKPGDGGHSTGSYYGDDYEQDYPYEPPNIYY